MSLIVLHGTWSQSNRSFFLWGEDAYRFASTRRRSSQKSTPKHPYLARLSDLYALFPNAEESTRNFLLPSTNDWGPLPSPELEIDPEFWFDANEVRQSTWSVSGLEFHPEETPTWLALQFQPFDEYTAGSDLRFWQQAARFGVELILRERFIPTYHPDQHAALWQPLLTEEADVERLFTLVEGLPPVSLAILKAHKRLADHQPPEPRELVEHFLKSTVDAQIRSWLGTELRRVRRPVRQQAPISPVEEWLGALASDFPCFRARGDQNLLPAIARWTEPLRNTGSNPAPTPVRSCLRLEVPEAEEPDSPWSLRLMLQALDEPTLLLPASLVWQSKGRPFSYLERRIDYPSGHLLANLEQAARIFPPLAALLNPDHPDSCPLSTTESYQFLSSAAQRLNGAGIEVLLPASLSQPARLTAKARVQSPKGGLSSLGLAQVLAVDWDLALGDDPIPLAELQRLARLKAPLVQWRGRWVALDPARLATLVRQLERRDGRITVGEALQLQAQENPELDGIPLSSLKLPSAVRSHLNRLNSLDRLSLLPPPQGLHGELRPYQIRGFSWLAFLRSYGIGACLADDMGLGKTVQVIALLLHERETGLTEIPTLLICPTSVVGNWQRELHRFAPSLKVMIHHGSKRLRSKAFAQAAKAHDIVVSTYALSHRDMADLKAMNWAGIILDEAQNIKNAGTRQSQSLRSLPSGYRIALTGTPVENRLAELWSLMDFLNPGYLGSAAEFQVRFAKPIERHGDELASKRLRRLVQPFLLRRVKTDPTVITDLPEKWEQPVYINLTSEQAGLYAAMVDRMLAQIENSEGIKRRGLVLATLTRLKQICNHPAQFLGDGSPLANRSGKLERLSAMLEEVLAGGDRALIFTQYAVMGHMLQKHLQALFGREVLFLHGGVPGETRLQMVQQFQAEAGPPLFILTLKAGGLGLNLTQASHVFHYDRWWNPAVESQATDRAFRIGQVKNVMVHKLIAAGTVEEKIDALIEGKRQLAERIVSTGEGWLTELNTAELRSLFTLDRE